MTGEFDEAKRAVDEWQRMLSANKPENILHPIQLSPEGWMCLRGSLEGVALWGIYAGGMSSDTYSDAEIDLIHEMWNRFPEQYGEIEVSGKEAALIGKSFKLEAERNLEYSIPTYEEVLQLYAYTFFDLTNHLSNFGVQADPELVAYFQGIQRRTI